jgi:hypothetical protein
VKGLGMAVAVLGVSITDEDERLLRLILGMQNEISIFHLSSNQILFLLLLGFLSR